jgi:GntR family transcriptional regulator
MTGSPTFSPLYRQIKALLVQALDAGEWRPGMAIPSEAELATRFSVSQGTVRKAIDELAADKMLVRRQGKGTFVATHNDPREYFRFLRLVPNNGEVVPARSVPLECWHAKAGPEPARMLDVAHGTPLIVVRRVLQFNGRNVVGDELYLPEEPFRGLDMPMLEAHEGSLYSLFEARFGVHMTRAQERVRAVLADREGAKLLGVDEGSPLLSVERISYTYGDRPMEWRRGLYSTVDHCYLNELN